MKNCSPQTIRSLLKKLLRSRLIRFPAELQPMDAATEPGVYLIYNSKGRIAHVGRSVRGRNGLRQRLYDHLQGNSSFTIEYLKGKGSKLRQGYKYKYLVITDPRQRALVEALAIGTLCPLHLGLGNAS